MGCAEITRSRFVMPMPRDAPLRRGYGEGRIRGQARLYAEARQVRKGLVGAEGLSPHLAKGTDRRRYRPASHRSAYKESIGSKLETDDLCKPAPG